MGGGISAAPSAAGGGDGAIADGRYEQVGTFNGNPLAMAAARATLTEVLTPAATPHLDALRRAWSRVHARDRRARAAVAGRHRRRQGLLDVPAGRCATTATSWRSTTALGHAHWLVQHNGGVFLPPWGKVEQWLIRCSTRRGDVDTLRRQRRDARRPAERLSRLDGGALQLVGLVKNFGDVPAVDGIDLDIAGRRVLLAARPLRAAARPRRCG